MCQNSYVRVGQVISSWIQGFIVRIEKVFIFRGYLNHLWPILPFYAS